jgi:hypothetical protein
MHPRHQTKSRRAASDRSPALSLVVSHFVPTVATAARFRPSLRWRKEAASNRRLPLRNSQGTSMRLHWVALGALGARYSPGMPLSSNDLRERSVALAAHSRELRQCAEAARLRSVQCWHRAQSAQHFGIASRTHSNAAQRRQDKRGGDETYCNLAASTTQREYGSQR